MVSYGHSMRRNVPADLLRKTGLILLMFMSTMERNQDNWIDHREHWRTSGECEAGPGISDISPLTLHWTGLDCTPSLMKCFQVEAENEIIA